MPKKRTITREIPLLEITLRRYERPHNLAPRELARKLCLSLGLLQPGDSRDIIVDIVRILVLHAREQKYLTMSELITEVSSLRKKEKLPLLGITLPNITRQIRRLKTLALVEKNIRGYRIREFLPLTEIYESHIEKLVIPSITARIKEYLNALDSEPYQKRGTPS